MAFAFLPTSARGPFKLVTTFALLVLLAGCGGPIGEVAGERTGTVTSETAALMEQDHMDRGAPILVRIFKEEGVLEVWKQDRTGHYAPLKAYQICHFSGGLGPKKAFGDHQAPEGFYEVGPGQMNPHSREYLAFNIGYPNAYDRSLGRTGDSIMVHGGCKSVGCYAMTNEQIDEIFGLAYESFRAGQMDIQVQAFPFRMTDENMISHAGDPNFEFWQMLKTGSDMFEATRLPPNVSVCNQRYDFARGDAAAGPTCAPQFSNSFNPTL